MKMFSMLLVLLPAIACIARDPTEGKEKVHSFEVKYNVSFPPPPRTPMMNSTELH